jgi:hypothetical protein
MSAIRALNADELALASGGNAPDANCPAADFNSWLAEKVRRGHPQIDLGGARLEAEPPSGPVRVTKEVAHVVRDENLFVHQVTRTAPNKFESEFCIDGAHPYLYENPAIANHVSGTTFLDVSRQLVKAICHLFHSLPLSNRFVLSTVAMDFTRWAKIDVPILAVVEAEPLKSIFGSLPMSTTGKVTFYQEGWEIGTITGKFMTFPAAIEERLMSRQFRQGARAQSVGKA